MSRVLRRLSSTSVSLVLPAIVLVLGLASGGCSVQVDYGNTEFSCSSGDCPSGYRCVSNVCLLESAEEEENDSPDAAIEEEETPDASVADAAVEEPDADLTPASCDALFSSAPGYELCFEQDQSCAFNVATAGGNCHQACNNLGSVCLGAFDNDENSLCVPVQGSTDTCDTQRDTEICVCARPQP